MTARAPADIKTQISTLQPDNTTRQISPADSRGPLDDLADSSVNAVAQSPGAFIIRGNEANEVVTPNLKQDMTTGNLEATAKAMFTPSIRVGATRLALTGNIVRLTGGTDEFLPAGVPITAAGTGEPVSVNLGAFGVLPAGANQTAIDTSLALAAGASMSFTTTVASGVAHVTAETDIQTVGAGTVRLQVFSGLVEDMDKIILDETKVVAAGTTTIAFDGWGLFETGADVFVKYTNVGAASVTLIGTGVGAGFRPYNLNRGYPYSVVLLESQLPNVRTISVLRDAIAAMVAGGNNSGLNIARNGNVLDFNVTGTTPPVTPTPSVSAFGTNIPTSVNNGDSLNNTYTINFTTQGTAQIASLSLNVIGAGNVKTFFLTVPTTDGAHTQQVALTGLTTATDGIIQVQIVGLTTTDTTVMSSVQNVVVRTQTADELAYYAVRASNDFVSAPLGELTSVDVQPPGQQYTISGSWPAGHTLGILEPGDRAISSIIATVLGVETYPASWTITASARTINAQAYNLLTITNNGRTGTFSYRVTHD